MGGAGIASRDRGGSVVETPSGGAATGDDDASIAARAVPLPAPLLAGACTSLGPAGGGVSTTSRDAGSGPGRYPVKNSRQLSPTEAGSTRNRSYMSSTSHAFGPNDPAAGSAGYGWSVTRPFVLASVMTPTLPALTRPAALLTRHRASFSTRRRRAAR